MLGIVIIFMIDDITYLDNKLSSNACPIHFTMFFT
jgi:hypothetical protein